MPPLGNEITTKKKKWYYYLPFLPTFCFITEIIGVAIWDINSRSALSRTHTSLKLLGLSIDTALIWSSEALAFTVALVVILALAMLALGAGRCVIAYQADRTGATRMGGRLIAWMWLDAIFIVLWFCLTLWLLLLLLGQCLWMAASWGLTTSIKVGAASARANIAAGINDTILHTNETASDCNLGCVDLAPFEWALHNNTCFCNLEVVDSADAAMKDALKTMEGSVAGAVMLLISGMWILMAAASEFGVTRRERQLLRRIAKARLMSGNTEASKLLPNGSASGGISGFGKKNKSKGSSSLSPPQPSVLVDHETGEVLDVEDPGGGRAPPASRSDHTGGGGGSSGGPDLKRSGSFVRAAKAMGKGISKTGRAFEVMGSFLSKR